jgi:hypothetical protein
LLDIFIELILSPATGKTVHGAYGMRTVRARHQSPDQIAAVSMRVDYLGPKLSDKSGEQAILAQVAASRDDDACHRNTPLEKPHYKGMIIRLCRRKDRGDMSTPALFLCKHCDDSFRAAFARGRENVKDLCSTD